MLINGTTVTGLFLFKLGLTYTKNDIIYYLDNDDLYKVNDVYIASITPDKSEACTEYFSDRFVTADTAKSLINKVFNGIGLNGEIAELNNLVNLNDYMNTGAYTLEVSSQINLPIGITSGNTVLFRVYKSASDIIQEIVDYSVPAMYYRSYFNGAWSSWSPITNATSDAVKNLISTYGSVNDKVTETASFLNDVKTSTRYLEEAAITKGDSVTVTPSNVNKVADLLAGVSYYENGLYYFDYMYLHAETDGKSLSKMVNGGVISIENSNGSYTVKIVSTPDGVSGTTISKMYLVNSLSNG
jgi:hypothetical protein